MKYKPTYPDNHFPPPASACQQADAAVASARNSTFSSAHGSQSSQQLSVNLVKHASSHLSFLQKLHSEGVTLAKPNKATLVRYQQWIDLVTSHTVDLWIRKEKQDPKSSSRESANGNDDDAELIPPADVAWLWHCHRLAPLRYEGFIKEQLRQKAENSNRAAAGLNHVDATDIESLLGMLEEANPPFAFQIEKDSFVFNPSSASKDLPPPPGNKATATGEEDEEEKNKSNRNQAAARNTQRVWDQMFLTAPFFLPLGSNSSSSDTKDASKNENGKNEDNDLDLHRECMDMFAGYDLIASASRQTDFLWQVSQPKFFEQQFLQDGLVQYIKFLHLRKAADAIGKLKMTTTTTTTTTATAQKKNDDSTANNNAPIIIIPTYQIDLHWHTHILSSTRAYRRDCESIIGYVMHHDDSLDDRTVGGVLDTSFGDTKSLWRQMYGEDYHCDGGMYRGEPPAEYYRTDWLPRLGGASGDHGTTVRNVAMLPYHVEQLCAPFASAVTVNDHDHHVGAATTNSAASFPPAPSAPAYAYAAAAVAHPVAVPVVSDMSSNNNNHNHKKGIWQYQESAERWNNYSPHDQIRLENAYASMWTAEMKDGNGFVTIRAASSQQVYSVDLQSLTQTNVRTQCRRSIRRVEEQAGAAFEGGGGRNASATAAGRAAIATNVADLLSSTSTPTRRNQSQYEWANSRDTFIPAPPSRFWYVRKQGYVFRDDRVSGPMLSIGYHSITTKGCYKLILDRLNEAIQVRERQIPLRALTFGKSKKRFKDDLKDLYAMRHIVVDRLSSKQRIGCVNLDESAMRRLGHKFYETKERKADGKLQYLWREPEELYLAAGGCGGMNLPPPPPSNRYR
mmetsp:Transcript_8187/g.23520  ORF Transcript_8187/g.23520 Transcript_8187/m.23520 type:complete len:848 (+) Transcript_8187:28-2571(+)|eukprot:CAMPEP_0119562756 /NCGR_PEP_ID=MMETSP1352-20130426/21431_1 /TAXON_ID=265584 /ORGANISM="Stauroneis constricta, Strain CCMP1120" /LENGTH=847 /DNA_ID=CAMNT_0007611219 /DNA_START=18 /DNA_END=2561 /DNA_ORIENTATION=+